MVLEPILEERQKAQVLGLIPRHQPLLAEFSLARKKGFNPSIQGAGDAIIS